MNTHHDVFLFLEAAEGHRLLVLVHELEVRCGLANGYHSQSRRAYTLLLIVTDTQDIQGVCTYDTRQHTKRQTHY